MSCIIFFQVKKYDIGGTRGGFVLQNDKFSFHSFNFFPLFFRFFLIFIIFFLFTEYNSVSEREISKKKRWKTTRRMDFFFLFLFQNTFIFFICIPRTVNASDIISSYTFNQKNTKQWKRRRIFYRRHKNPW